ncbi:hypothetical protein CU098_011938 [Rhizopus stolonifer]|uniref:UspA domain-containing protein n=1 Tax=Rhizopus stolonifer TaxID=4846 RepID=A0A367KM56_RHIST|nr:hypothetical protein CU098_011938 [Rhizopus stolonifer]
MTIAFDQESLIKHASSVSLVDSRHSITTSLCTYQRRVSFDNVTNISPNYHSYTLKQSSQGFERTRRSRIFMVVIDLLRTSAKENIKIKDPLIFTLMNLIDEGDEIVVIGVQSSLHDTEQQTSLSKRKAQEIMDWIVEFHQGDHINMIVELTFGRPEIILEEMTRMYQPSMVIVGACNKIKYKHAYSGAGIFKYRLKHTHTPIVVVRDKQAVTMKPLVHPKHTLSERIREKLAKLNCTK